MPVGAIPDSDDERDEQEKRRQRSGDCSGVSHCTGFCDVYRSTWCEDVFICKRSGRIHYCTSSSCDALIYNNEERVCSITGHHYALDEFNSGPTTEEFADICRRENRHYDPDQLEQLLEEYQRDIVREMQQNAVSIEEEPFALCTAPAGANVYLPASSSSSSSSSLDDEHKRRKSAARQRKKQRQRRVFAETNALLSRVGADGQSAPSQSPPLQPPTTYTRKKQKKRKSTQALICQAQHLIQGVVVEIGENDLTRLAIMCVMLWGRITQTRLYDEVKARYLFQNHVIATLYNAVQGIRVEGVEFIRAEPLLEHRLPPAKTVLRAFNIEPYVHTRSCCHLHMLALELSA